MKISKIYSNNKTMKPIIFNRGFNVIYGDIDDDLTNENEHNLGKTSLIHLIDFLLLKKITKDHFLSKYQTKFSGWVFYIELELCSGRYLTIRRSADTPSLVSFKEHENRDQDLSSSVDWDKKDLKLYSKKDDPISIFEEYLDFSVLQLYQLRDFLPYLLRTQYDYEDIFKMRQFQGLDIDWKPRLFSLLGYNDESVTKKYRIQYEVKNYQDLLKTITGNKKNGSNDSYIIKAAIAEKESEKKLIIEQINQFDFYLKEKNLNKELVEETESKISKLNSERYRLEYEIDRIKESLDNKISFDIGEIESIFNEASIFLSDQLKKNYEDLLNFNISLSEERSKYLKEDLSLNSEYLSKVESELLRLNQEKESILSFLRETDTFAKYKSLQNEIIKLDDQINQFKIKLESLGTAENYERKIESLKRESRDIAENIKATIDSGSVIFSSINNIFKDIYYKVMLHKAILVVRPNKEGNPDFSSIIIDNKDEDQLIGQGDGYSATKIQCASFVLSLLSVYSKERFFRFAYHDGIIEGCGDNPKINFFNEARAVCDKYGIQYIISAIKSDIPNKFEFGDDEIVCQLTKNDPLFGFSF